MLNRGRFIVIEGIDGSGSTTHVRGITDHLRKRHLTVHATREPTAGPAGAVIQMALSHRITGPPNGSGRETAPGGPMDPRSLALLFAADRTDHWATDIHPHLDNGIHVVCDRYTLSSYAYQSMFEDIDWIREINSRVPAPDLTIYLDIPAGLAVSRMRRTRIRADLFETEHQLETVRKNYVAFIRRGYPELGPIVTVDSSQRYERVRREVEAAVDSLLEFDDPRADISAQLFDPSTLHDSSVSRTIDSD